MNSRLNSLNLEKFLAELPDTFRKPMVMAVTASALAHGLFFVALPKLASSATKNQPPERVVNLIELTPEEQANLPQTMSVEQLPFDTEPTQAPLAQLSPGTPLPNSTSILPPVNSSTPSLDDLLKDFALDQPQVTFVPPPQPLFETEPQQIFTRPVPSVPASPTPPPTPTQPAAKPTEPPQPQPSPSPSPTQQTPQPTVSPTPQLSRDELNRRLLEEGRQRYAQAIAARTYNPAQATKEHQQGQSKLMVNGLVQAVIRQQQASLAQLPEEQQQTELRKIFQNYEALYADRVTQSLDLQTIPAESSIIHPQNQPKEKRYEAVFLTYVNEDGSLAIKPPQKIKSSGVPLLDQRAEQLLEEFLKSQPDLAKSTFVEFTVPFAPASQADA